MNPATKWVTDAMTYLSAGYPNNKPSPEQWSSQLKAYGMMLSGYHHEVVRRAVTKAHAAHPKFFPTLGELRELCEAAKKGHDLEVKRQPLPASRQIESRKLPETPEARQAYIDEAENPWERRAREWELNPPRPGRAQGELAKVVQGVGK